MIALLNGGLVSIFGSILSASFCDIFTTRKKKWTFISGISVMLMLQGIFWDYLDAGQMQRFYPLIMHLPLIILLYCMSGRLLWTVISVLMAYLCCQLRLWIALLGTMLLSGNAQTQEFMEVLITLPIMGFLLYSASPVIRRLGRYPAKSQWQFGIIPALYYLFDYVTNVYTDLLSSGTPIAVEFMPFVCCAAYLVFLLYNSEEERKRNQLEQVQKCLDVQLSQAFREIDTMKESQFLAGRYRHDLRHHLQYISACIDDGQTEKVQPYIAGICEEIEAQKVERYCENEAANLILSAFVGRAQKDGIIMNVRGILPEHITISDMDLCVLLSNALENALHACQGLTAEVTECIIDVQFYEKDNKLFLQITNPCGKNICFENGIPVSDEEGHGIGVQSICAIVKRYRGICDFQIRDGQFILRISL